MLSLLHLSKRFGAVQALDDCGFEVGRGRMLGFLGPNGAGKTTTMRAIFGLVSLDRGDITWDNVPLDFGVRLRFGYMPEERGLYARMHVLDELVYFARLHGLAVDAARREATGWLERLDLAERAQSKVEQLSHGNQQRVQLAAALVHKPELIVLDEPFSGLDPLAVQSLAEVLRREAARGAAVLFSSHQLELVEDLCDDVAIIDQGHIVTSGRVDDLKARSGRLRIELRLEQPAAGWIPDVAGIELLERRNDNLRLLVDRSVDPEAVLAAAARSGRVLEFSFGPPSLGELFLEAVQR
ncbi:MAG: ABC transporter ATP-binding protein [Gaiellaceae bacterium]